MKERFGNEMVEIILLELEGTASNEQFERFQQWLDTEPGAIEFYVELMMLYSGITQPGHFSFPDSAEGASSAVMNDEFWQELAEYEKTAAGIEVPQPVPEKQIIQKVIYEKRSYKVSKSTIFSAFVSAAAILFVVLFVQFAPHRKGLTVATLADSIDAQWDGDEILIPGMRLMIHQPPLSLRKGMVKIQFDNHAEVLLEAPAEFQILSGKQMHLSIGKLFARIPQQASGFSVDTPNSKVVDLGTEFGIEVDIQGNTDLHVIRGMTHLFCGIGKSKQVSVVSEGMAKKVTGAAVQPASIPCDATLFVRQIDSDSRLIWKGENAVDLADIVNGGAGFGTGRRGYCIDPQTGDLKPIEPVMNEQSTASEIQWDSNASYLRPVKSLEAVDCIIVPSQKGGRLPLTTTGLTVPDYPTLKGALRWPIQTQSYEGQYPLVLKGLQYGTKEHPAILIHSSCGITFDLEAVRRHLPDMILSSFEALCGNSESVAANDTEDPEALQRTTDLSIYLDGGLVYEHSFAHIRDAASLVRIDLADQNPRFLTLLATCGQKGNDFDWFVFGDPKLLLEWN